MIEERLIQRRDNKGLAYVDWAMAYSAKTGKRVYAQKKFSFRFAKERQNGPKKYQPMLVISCSMANCFLHKNRLLGLVEMSGADSQNTGTLSQIAIPCVAAGLNQTFYHGPRLRDMCHPNLDVTSARQIPNEEFGFLTPHATGDYREDLWRPDKGQKVLGLFDIADGIYSVLRRKLLGERAVMPDEEEMTEMFGTFFTWALDQELIYVG